MQKNNKQKKENKKTFWTYFVPIFVGITILTSIFFVTYNLITEKYFKSYEDYEKYEIKYSNKILTKTNDNYYVFVYKNNCSGCSSVKRYIFQYIDKYNENPTETHPKMYIMNISEHLDLGSNSENLINVSDYKQLGIKYTPTLILVQSNTVKTACNNADDVYNTIKTAL